MPAPSQLMIATGAVKRLGKEKATYYKEITEGEARLARMEEELRASGPSADGNAEFLIKQQKTSIEQTKGVFAPLQTRIDDSVARLADLVEAEERSGGAAPANELEAARAALKDARAEAGDA